MKKIILSVMLAGSMVSGVCRATTDYKAQDLSRAIHVETTALLKEKLDHSLRQQIKLLLESEMIKTTAPASEEEDLRFSDSIGEPTPCIAPPAK